MKRLITFFSICAVPVFLASNALAAVEQYGTYDATCDTDDIRVKIWGYGYSSYGTAGQFGVIYDTVLSVQNYKWNIYYNFSSGYLSKTIPITQNDGYKLSDGTVITAGLKPRGIVYYSAGALGENQPTETVFKNKDNNYIATKTSCGLARFRSGYTGNKEKLAIAFEVPYSGFNTKERTLSDTVKTLLIDNLNVKQVNLIVVYAAACQDNTNATCNLEIKSSGSAIYSNKCEGGCFMDGGSFGVTQGICVDAPAIAPVSVAAPASKPPAS